MLSLVALLVAVVSNSKNKLEVAKLIKLNFSSTIFDRFYFNLKVEFRIVYRWDVFSKTCSKCNSLPKDIEKSRYLSCF